MAGKNGGGRAKSVGDRGEEAAARYLTGRGCEVLARNYHSRYGEIDMIAALAPYILFVEVKARGENAYGQPAEAVDARKQKKLMRTAVEYLSKHPSDLQPRFDVVEVFFAGGSEEAEIHHIPNAFWLEDSYGLF